MVNLNFNTLDLRGGFCLEQLPEPFGMVIFGASGDLTKRKLIPALFNLYVERKLPNKFYILGFARTALNVERFRDGLKSFLPNHTMRDEFLSHCYYTQGAYTAEEDYNSLKKKVAELNNRYGVPGNMLYYLATPYTLFCPIATNLMKKGLAEEKVEAGIWKRVVIEKPFGSDLNSALELDRELKKYLMENQIYRIDHYLGKETVQNILMLRFANIIFESIWNRQYIDHIQITIAEKLGVEQRAGYFDKAGLLRDIFQNHVLQIISMIAMEPPISFEADRVRDEKVKLMCSIKPFPLDELDSWIVRGQYSAGKIDGEEVVGYREERGVAPDSITETFVAAKIIIDNWRWAGVPFYVRAGKRLPKKLTEVAITFKKVPHSMFYPMSETELFQNQLILRIQPEEGISLIIQGKHPGPKLCMTPLVMDFNYIEKLGDRIPSAYERLLLDCMIGDQMLFWRSDGIEAAWALVTPVLEKWAEQKEEGLFFYPAGSWGPEEVNRLFPDWRDV